MFELVDRHHHRVERPPDPDLMLVVAADLGSGQSLVRTAWQIAAIRTARREYRARSPGPEKQNGPEGPLCEGD